MEHLFLTYELSLLVKSKGFNEPCFGYFDPLYHKLVIYDSGNNNKNSEMVWVAAPMYQQIIDWLLDEHHINIIPDVSKIVICESGAYYRILERDIKTALKLI